jgi:nucleotide-binding universal stress UspA family protein
MARMRRILHASDFSRASRAAFDRAVEMAQAEDAELVIAHVMSVAMPVVGEGYISPKVYEDIERSAREHAQKQLSGLVARAEKVGARATGLLLEGIPHERIVQAARSKRADVIVIGTHGRTGIARVFLGSVAARVVAIAPCPVLTVRGK